MDDLNSGTNVPNKKCARRSRTNINTLPSELLVTIMSFSASSISELAASAASARSFRAAAVALSADGNAAVWEHEFCSRDAVLHQSFLSAAQNQTIPALPSSQPSASTLPACPSLPSCSPSTSSSSSCPPSTPPTLQSSTWRGRLRRLVDLGKPGPADVIVPLADGLQEQLRCADFVLHRHPSHGFLLHLSEFRGTIVAYALRVPASATIDRKTSSSLPSSCALVGSATKAKLDVFHCLPEMPDGHRPRAPAATLLLLRGVNDRPIHAFHSLAGVLACVQASGRGSELCSWQFMECPTRALTELPRACRLAPPPSPPMVVVT